MFNARVKLAILTTYLFLIHKGIIVANVCQIFIGLKNDETISFSGFFISQLDILDLIGYYLKEFT